MIFSIVFFFSSRRRHTRWPRDWSSDVCSSDLGWLREVAGTFERGDQHGGRAIVLEGTVEQPDRLGDRTRRAPVVERYLVAHDCRGVPARVEPLGNGLHPEVLG